MQYKFTVQYPASRVASRKVEGDSVRRVTVQRVNEASFFEETTSRSCEAVNGFHNVTFGPGGKAIISCSVFR